MARPIGRFPSFQGGYNRATLLLCMCILGTSQPLLKAQGPAGGLSAAAPPRLVLRGRAGREATAGEAARRECSFLSAWGVVCIWHRMASRGVRPPTRRRRAGTRSVHGLASNCCGRPIFASRGGPPIPFVRAPGRGAGARGARGRLVLGRPRRGYQGNGGGLPAGACKGRGPRQSNGATAVRVRRLRGGRLNWTCGNAGRGGGAMRIRRVRAPERRRGGETQPAAGGWLRLKRASSRELRLRPAGGAAPRAARRGAGGTAARRRGSEQLPHTRAGLRRRSPKAP